MAKKFLFLWCGLLLFPLLAAGQDLIFKKEGVVVRARILEKTYRSLTWRSFDQPDSTRFHTSLEMVDSIRYEDGRKEIFESPAESETPASLNLFAAPSSTEKIRHHLLGVDLVGALYNNLSLSYEFMPGKARVGFRVSFTDNRGDETFYTYEGEDAYRGNLNQQTNWHGMAGANIYLFPQGSFRLGTGLHYCFGKRDEVIMTWSESGQSYVEKARDTRISGLLWSLSLLGGYLHKNLVTVTAIDVPLIIDPPFRTILFRGEILLNF